MSLLIKKVTNGRIVESICPQKEETHRTKLTVGGNLLDYHGDTSTPTIVLHITKIIQTSKTSISIIFYMTVN